jgi:uncharacterized protein YukE
MDDGTYSYTVPGLIDAISTINTQSTAIQTMLDGLIQGTTTNLQDWSAASREEYNSYQANWNGCATEMSQKAQLAAKALSDALEILEATEHANLKQWPLS